VTRSRYSEILLDHFYHPRNAGELPDADGVGTAGDPNCGDAMTIWIRVRDERIEDIRFKCRGCPAAIACGSVTTELGKGKDLDAASLIAEDTISEALGGLPPEKRHCSNLASAALANAAWDYILRSVRRTWAEWQGEGHGPSRAGSTERT